MSLKHLPFKRALKGYTSKLFLIRPAVLDACSNLQPWMYGAIIDISVRAINAKINYTFNFARQYSVDRSKWRILHLHKRLTVRFFKIFLLPFVCFLRFCHITSDLEMSIHLYTQTRKRMDNSLFCGVSLVYYPNWEILITTSSLQFSPEKLLLNRKILVTSSSLQPSPGRILSKQINSGHYVIATTQSGKITN